jgi:hypothetical protein
MNSTPCLHQLVQEYNGIAMREQLVEMVRNQQTAFLDRAVHDCLSRLGLTLPEALTRLMRHLGPSWEELYLDGERVLRVSWLHEDGSCHMSRTFHGPAELPRNPPVTV